jgi:hypothetical protein
MALVEDIGRAHAIALRTDALRVMLDCGHWSEPSLVMDPNGGIGGAAGYATTADGRRICYADADAAQRDELRTAARFTAYLSGDGKTVTTWSGGTLGRVTAQWESKRARKTYVRVTDVHGGTWSGQGPAESGTYVSLRRVKGDN